MATAAVNYSSTTDSTNIPITLASLASSSSLTAGRQSDIVTNVTNKFMDARVFGQIRVGASGLTAGKRIAVYIFAPIKIASSTFTYPTATTTALGEADAARTFESEQLSGLRLGAVIAINATGSRDYSFSFSIAEKFGGIMPVKWGLWVVQETGASLDSTAGNHWAHYTGIKYDVA